MAIKKITVKIRLLKPGAQLPYQATVASSGFDLYAVSSSIIKAGSFGVVDTGIAIEMPTGIEAQIRPRSGLAFHKGIGILNSPGTIDPDYRGEIKVILFNVSDTDFLIKPGDRIAQIVFSRFTPVKFEITDNLSPTQRDKGGFGHTG